MMLRRAVFFDRDGVLNVDHGYVGSPDRFEWTRGAREAVAWLKDNGWLVFVVTNQSGVARGMYTEADVKALHRHMQAELAEIGAAIDDFRFCPHHPDGKVARLAIRCGCRKPAPGMVIDLIETWAIDRPRSVLFGDNASDIAAAEAAGIKGVRFPGGDLSSFVKSAVSEVPPGIRLAGVEPDNS